MPTNVCSFGLVDRFLVSCSGEFCPTCVAINRLENDELWPPGVPYWCCSGIIYWLCLIDHCFSHIVQNVFIMTYP